MEKYEEALYQLRVANGSVISFELRRLNQIVLDDPLFYTAPGGSEHHHKYKHGLVIHVNEVMLNVFSMTKDRPSGELITAVIWHDYMKIRDYAISLEGEVLKLPYRKLINHVSVSAMEFHRTAYGKIPLMEMEKIEHMLLSHH